MANAKGMSMAIEIFIILFVLLAVAMLVLRMVTEQTEQQIRIIGEEQRKSELKQIKADCQAACTCDTLRGKVGYCLKVIDSQTFGQGKMDFTGDGFTTGYAEPPETGGLYGLCEDKVYCSQISDCKCGSQELSMQNCFRLACQLWGSQVPSGEDTDTYVQNLMGRFFPQPTCNMTDEETLNQWNFVYSGEMMCGAEAG
jgi:hypothetical protein